MKQYGDEFWEDLYKADAAEAYVNGAYTETGDQVYCGVCGDEMIFDPDSRVWKCRSCFTVKTRVQWFDYLDANPPGHKCLTQCQENYPVCKNWCMLYEIPDDDPIL